MNFFSILSVILDICASGPYAVQVFKGRVRPHPFTWIIWTLLTLIMAIVQYDEGAGGGGWLLISTSILNIIIVVLSFKYGTRDIARSDYVALAFCMGCIPLYFVFDMPELTSLVITIIDCVSFYPMLRKSLRDPSGESALFQGVMASAYASSLLAMDTVSVATALFPAAMVVMHGMSGLFLVILRKRKG